MPKVKKKRSGIGRSECHAPLGKIIEEDIERRKYAISRSFPREKKKKVVGWEKEELLDERSSLKILDMSRKQQLEVEIEDKIHFRKELDESKCRIFASEDMEIGDKNEEENGSIIMDDDFHDDTLVCHEAGYVNISDTVDGISKEEEAVLEAMMGNNQEKRRNLADIILGKIAEKEVQQMNTTVDSYTALPTKVVEIYTEIGRMLNRYTSGKLPKAFKIIPSLSNWEEILYLTRPHEWTPQAMFAATRIFASNLNPKMAQRFYNLVLLDSVRSDIAEHKKLNYHYYMSLKKAVYKSAAFFKGILLPLCKEKCTLREAVIVASVLQRVSIPVHHSAVAIHKLAHYEYSGAASIFLKTLLNKKYSLPVPVIGSMVQHFTAALNTSNTTLPVLWHQCLLVFIQRYKNELQDEARESLRSVMKVHFHPKITPEIRRELFGAQAWKEERDVVMTTSERNI